jgi:hypothetical protein
MPPAIEAMIEKWGRCRRSPHAGIPSAPVLRAAGRHGQRTATAPLADARPGLFRESDWDSLSHAHQIDWRNLSDLAMNKFRHSVRSFCKRSRWLYSPLKARDLQSLDPAGHSVKIGLPCGDADFRKLARLLSRYPKACLWVDSYLLFRRGSNLDFLEHFPFLRRLHISIERLWDVEGLRYVGPQLEELQLGWLTPVKRHSLRCLERFRNLKVLWLEGAAKDIEVIGTMKGLKEINWYGGRIADLSNLKALNSLQVLSLTNGGSQNLDRLPEMPNLRHLALRGVVGLKDLGRLTE